MSSMLWFAAAASASTAQPTAESLIEHARATYAVEKPRVEVCPQSSENEIVVCREIGDPDRYRVPSDTDRGVVKDEIPRAPDLDPHYHGNVANVKGCFIPPCAGPPPLIIDLDKIPEAPPGSDADLIARGLKAER